MEKYDAVSNCFIVYEAAYAYKGQTIIVHYGVVEGLIKISDAWVKTR